MHVCVCVCVCVCIDNGFDSRGEAYLYKSVRNKKVGQTYDL